MFRRVGLETNLDKTKTLLCTTGYIRGKWSEKAYKHRTTREGATFRERKRERASCTEYGVTVAASSVKGHMETKNDISIPQTREVGIGGRGEPVTYVVSFPWVLKTVR